MSTIVYRDRVLAADSAVWDRDTWVASTEKIWRCRAGGLWGAVGSFSDLVALKVWTMKGMDTPPPKFSTQNSEGMVVWKNGIVEWYGIDNHTERVAAPFYAIGSGFQVALGALHAGATAEEAIRIACKIDCYTREPITVLRFD